MDGHTWLNVMGQVIYNCILYDRPCISSWINPMFNELDILFHVVASELSGHCDVISKRLWCRQQNVNWANEARGDVWRSLFLSSIIDSLCRVRNEIMFVLSWRNAYARASVSFVFIRIVAAQLGKQTLK